jgi:hypothetical protein
MTDQDALQTFLADRDYECPVCRYNLRGLQDTSCPECGARLDLQVGSIDLRLGPWVTAMLAIAIPLGFNAVLGVVGLTMALSGRERWERRDTLVFGACVGMAIAGSIAIFVLCRRRRLMLRKKPREQRLIATIVVIVMAVVVATEVWFLNRA